MAVTLKYLHAEQNRLNFGVCGLLAVHTCIWGRILGHPVQSLGIKEHLFKFKSVTAGVKQSTKVLGPLVISVLPSGLFIM